jgi:hypothetical protein
MWKNFAVHLRFTYTIDLEKSLDEIWASLFPLQTWDHARERTFT